MYLILQLTHHRKDDQDNKISIVDNTDNRSTISDLLESTRPGVRPGDPRQALHPASPSPVCDANYTRLTVLPPRITYVR